MASVIFEGDHTGLRITIDQVAATVELLGGDGLSVERSWPADPTALKAVLAGYGFQIAQSEEAFVTMIPSGNLVRIHYKTPSSPPKTCVVTTDELQDLLHLSV